LMRSKKVISDADALVRIVTKRAAKIAGQKQREWFIREVMKNMERNMLPKQRPLSSAIKIEIARG